MVIWGASGDVNTVEGCNKLLGYLKTVLGPTVAQYTIPRKIQESSSTNTADLNTVDQTTSSDTLRRRTKLHYNQYSKDTESSTTELDINETSTGILEIDSPLLNTIVNTSPKTDLENIDSTSNDGSMRSTDSSTSTFKVYWNVPTFQCSSKKIYFHNLLKNFSIIHNDNDQFDENKITILYNPGLFPKLNGNETINGGVPQKGDLNKHLHMFRQDINKKIPNTNFSGEYV